jgi:hypothetical protein
MKYIMVNHMYPIVFPDAIVHSDFKIEGRRITSAGFVGINKTYGDLFTYGDSISLKMSPAKEDVIYLKRLLSGFSDLDLMNLALLMALHKEKDNG